MFKNKMLKIFQIITKEKKLLIAIYRAQSGSPLCFVIRKPNCLSSAHFI